MAKKRKGKKSKGKIPLHVLVDRAERLDRLIDRRRK